MTERGPENEFYTARRHRLVDGTSLVGFLLGFLGAAPFAWPRLASHWLAGDITGSVAGFLVTILGAGVVLGIAGMAIGSVVATVWRRRHERARVYESDDPAESAAARQRGQRGW